MQKKKNDLLYDHVQFEIDNTCKQDELLAVQSWNDEVRNIKEENVIWLCDLGNWNEAEEWPIISDTPKMSS